MKRYILITSVLVILTLTLAVSAVDFENETIKGLNITTDVDGALSEAQIQNKSIALIFDQDSCVYCEIFKDDVLSDKNIQKELNEKFIVVIVDINKNPDIAGKYDVFGTPTVQFIDSNGDEISKIEGYIDSDDFSKALKEI